MGILHKKGLLSKVKFDLTAQDDFVSSRSITFEHWTAIPSPIGLQDSGEYRRSDMSDTITSNGFIYTKAGDFEGTLVGNSHSKNEIDGGVFDDANGNLVLPRYYNNSKKEISMLPGDRVYVKKIELRVENYQKADFNHNSLIDSLQFPINSVSILLDSLNNHYKQGVDFNIDSNGHIKWSTNSNPGINEKTGKGRVYSVRYTYNAFWYVSRLLNEIRVTKDINGKTQRMPFSVQIQREYLYHNKNKTSTSNPQSLNEDSRTNNKPKSNTSAGNHEVNVEVSNFK